MVYKKITFTESDAAQFIMFWKKLYKYPRPALYSDNIGKPLTAARVWALFTWKNGMSNISTKKRLVIQKKYLITLESLPNITTCEMAKAYLEKWAEGSSGAVWDIFWLHCLNPSLYPIFDQHTYRAMTAIRGGKPKEIGTYRRSILMKYFDEYRGFAAELALRTKMDMIAVDQSLFSYGKFLADDLAIVL